MIGGSLFSGIEGFGLGLLWSGLITEIAFQVEVDPFCRRVLAARFPHVDRSVQDVRLASNQSLPRVDVLFGGPPCQDVSGAGKGAGLDGERSGLVREMLRLVDELRPRVVLLENVASGARRWVCPVRGALEAFGYRTTALNIGVDDCGGPHRRRRIVVLAYADRDSARRARRQRSSDNDARRPGSQNRARDVGYANSEVCGEQSDTPQRETVGGEAAKRSGRRHAESGLGFGVDGLPSRVVRWPAGPGAEQEEWEPPRVLAGVQERAAKLRALGNAVSPIQAYHVGLWAIDVLRGEGDLRRYA